MSTAAPEKPAFYVWFDTEYSTLELDQACILQLAVMVTDHELKRVTAPEDDLNLVIRIGEDQPVSPWIQENLPQLVDACHSDSAVSVERADAEISAFLDRTVGPAAPAILDRPVLAGNSIHADWFLARKFLPTFLGRLHYRVLDVTCLKLIWQDHFRGPPFDKEDPNNIRLYFPGASLASGVTVHDAYYDIQASVAELAYYRSSLQRRDEVPG